VLPPEDRNETSSLSHAMTTPDGIINFDKPTGITSAKALYKIRSITRQRKSGHAGTLDPGASGVLVICMGRATKLVEAIMNQPKVYRATARLDVTSESFDSGRPMIPMEVSVEPPMDGVHDALMSFEGTIEQVPPAVSAIKVGGVASYKRAARGQEVKLGPRPVNIYWLHLHSYAWPDIDFEVCCGRGTYIRSLIRDIGERLGTGGCLTSLVRKQVGPFLDTDAWTLDRLREAAGQSEYLVPLDRARELLIKEPVEVPRRPLPS